MANDNNTPSGNNPPSNDNPSPTRNNPSDRNRDQLREVFERYSGNQQQNNVQRQNIDSTEGIVNLLNRTRRDLGDLRNLTQARLKSSITNRDASTLNVGNNPLNDNRDTSALKEHSRVQSQTLISMDGKLEDLLLSQRVVQRDTNKILYGVIELLSRKNRDDDESNTIIINNYFDGEGGSGGEGGLGLDVDLDRRRRKGNRRNQNRRQQNRPKPNQRPTAPRGTPSSGRPPGGIGGMARGLLGRAVTAGATTAATVVGTVAAIGGAFRLSESLTPESQMGAQRRTPEEIQTLISQNRSVRFTQDVEPFKKDEIVDINRVLSTFGYSENDAPEALRQLLDSRQIELVPQGQVPTAQATPAPQAAPTGPVTPQAAPTGPVTPQAAPTGPVTNGPGPVASILGIGIRLADLQNLVPSMPSIQIPQPPAIPQHRSEVSSRDAERAGVLSPQGTVMPLPLNQVTPDIPPNRPRPLIETILETIDQDIQRYLQRRVDTAYEQIRDRFREKLLGLLNKVQEHELVGTHGSRYFNMEAFIFTAQQIQTLINLPNLAENELQIVQLLDNLEDMVEGAIIRLQTAREIAERQLRIVDGIRDEQGRQSVDAQGDMARLSPLPEPQTPDALPTPPEFVPPPDALPTPPEFVPPPNAPSSTRAVDRNSRNNEPFRTLQSSNITRRDNFTEITQSAQRLENAGFETSEDNVSQQIIRQNPRTRSINVGNRIREGSNSSNISVNAQEYSIDTRRNINLTGANIILDAESIILRTNNEDIDLLEAATPDPNFTPTTPVSARQRAGNPGMIAAQRIAQGGNTPQSTSPASPGVSERTSTIPRVSSRVDGTSGVIPSEGLGGLSSRYESRGNAGAIGFDSTGGYSYGTYQIATRTGTMNNFMNYLRDSNPEMFERLQRAGGIQGAQSGSPEFRAAWQEMSRDQDFGRAQHEFIRITHYEPVARTARNLGIDVENRSAALRDVLWSTGVQHGGGTNVIQRALQRLGRSGSEVSDEDLIRAIYEERRTRFGSSTERVQAAVQNRFTSEQAGALQMLQRENGGQAIMEPPRPNMGAVLDAQSRTREVGQTIPTPTATPASAQQNMAAPANYSGNRELSGGLGGGLDIGSVHPAPGLMAEFSRESSQPSIIRPPSAMGMGLHRTPSFTA